MALGGMGLRVVRLWLGPLCEGAEGSMTEVTAQSYKNDYACFQKFANESET